MRSFRFSLLVSLGAAALLLSCDDDTVRKQIRRTLHLPRILAAVEPENYGMFSPAADVLADRVSYATEAGLRIPAIVYRSAHPKAKRGPALIIVNGHGGDKSSWYAYWAGIVYARAGAVVLTYDPIGEFERNHLRQSVTSQHDELLVPDDMARRMAGQMINDIRQSVSYLRSRKDVDKGRIAILGYSMGSFISSLACAVETRAHACVLVAGGDLDGPGGYWDSSGKKMCQAIPYQSLQFLGDRGAALFALSAHRGPTLVWNGDADRVVDIPHHGAAFFQDLQNRTLQMPGVSRKNVFQFGFTPGGGHRPYFLTKPVALWLAETLHFPNLTPADIEAMPETRVSNWAADHHLTASNFTSAENEGGTMAIGADIPAVNRDLLHAIPDALWNSRRGRYEYETWVEHSRAAMRAGEADEKY